jgi:hypothetical protein
MALLIDDTLTTSLLAVPFTEGWVETPIPVTVKEGLQAGDVTSEDVALLSVAETTLLVDTHVIISDIGIVLDGIGPIAMRTPIRPDGVDATVVRMLDAGSTAELLVRALLRPYFGISATSFARSDTDPGASTAEVVVVDGALGLQQPEAGHQSDLVRDWFVFTGHATVSHAVVIGLHALARGPEDALAALAMAEELGRERRREIRGIAAARWGVDDREAFADMTNRQRFALTQEDRNSLANLVARGTWGSRFGKRLPVYRDMVDEGTVDDEMNDEEATDA